MISIGKQYLDTALEQILATLRPYRGVRADGHKGGREHFVVTRTESSGARPRARCRGFEGEIQPLHAGAGYRLALRKGRFAARLETGGAILLASPTARVVRSARACR